MQEMKALECCTMLRQQSNSYDHSLAMSQCTHLPCPTLEVISEAESLITEIYYVYSC